MKHRAQVKRLEKLHNRREQLLAKLDAIRDEIAAIHQEIAKRN